MQLEIGERGNKQRIFYKKRENMFHKASFFWEKERKKKERLKGQIKQQYNFNKKGNIKILEILRKMDFYIIFS